MAPKHTKSTTNVASNIMLSDWLGNEIKSDSGLFHKDGKSDGYWSVKHAPFYHRYDLEEQSDGSCWRICFIEGIKTKKKLRRAYIKHGETSSDLHWWPSTEAYPYNPHSNHGQSKRLDSTTILNLLLTLGGLNDQRIVIHYIMWKWLVHLQMLMWSIFENSR